VTIIELINANSEVRHAAYRWPHELYSSEFSIADTTIGRSGKTAVFMTQFVNSLPKIEDCILEASILRKAYDPLRKCHPSITPFSYADYPPPHFSP